MNAGQKKVIFACLCLALFFTAFPPIVGKGLFTEFLFALPLPPIDWWPLALIYAFVFIAGAIGWLLCRD